MKKKNKHVANYQKVKHLSELEYSQKIVQTIKDETSRQDMPKASFYKYKKRYNEGGRAKVKREDKLSKSQLKPLYNLLKSDCKKEGKVKLDKIIKHYDIIKNIVREYRSSYPSLDIDILARLIRYNHEITVSQQEVLDICSIITLSKKDQIKAEKEETKWECQLCKNTFSPTRHKINSCPNENCQGIGPDFELKNFQKVHIS